MCFSTPQPISQTKQRGFREKTSGAGAGSIHKIWNHTSSCAYDRILILKTWFYKLWVIFESGNIFFTALLRMSAEAIGRLSPVIILHIITSPRLIDLCCSTSVDDFATNEVIDMIEFLVFNNCWCVFDSLCFWQSFLPAYLHEKSVLLTERWTLHSTFWDEWSMSCGCDTNPCISVVIFFSSSGQWGGHCPHHQLNRYMLWTPHGWHFFNVLKQALFVRNGDKLEVFRNHNIS